MFKAKKLSLEELKLLFKQKFVIGSETEEDFEYNFLKRYDLLIYDSKIFKDLNLSFDFENNTIGVEPNQYVEFENNLVGFNTLENGLSFYGIVAHGDWEWPVFFIIYHDGNDFRGYLPEKGNLWNTDTRMAYGNDSYGINDAKNFIKRFPDKVKELSVDFFDCNYDELTTEKIEDLKKSITTDFIDIYIESLDWELIKEDILENCKLIDNLINPKIEEKPSWQTYFMTLAFFVSQRSIDPDTNHGCVIVDDDNTILSTGYNSPPRGCLDEEIPYTRPEKYKYIKHAELAAIVNATRNGVKLKDSTIYVTGHPCEDCFGHIINAGIKKIYYGPVGSACVNEETKKIIAKMNHDGRIELILFEDGNSVHELIGKTKEYIKRKTTK